LSDAEVESGEAYSGESRDRYAFRSQAGFFFVVDFFFLFFFLFFFFNASGGLLGWDSRRALPVVRGELARSGNCVLRVVALSCCFLYRFGAGDQPNGHDRKREAGERPGLRGALDRDIGESGDGGAEQRGDGSSESHFSLGQGAIKNRERESSDSACEQRPEDAGVGREWGMSCEGQSDHEGQRAEVGECSGAAGSVPAREIAGAPDENGGQATGGGGELGRGRHARRG